MTDIKIRKKIKKIFQDAHDDLCSFLPTDSGFLQTLVDNEVLNGGDKERVEDIEGRKQKQKQREEMIDILQEKDSKAYFRFMDILEKNQSGIYELLEELEGRHELTERKTAIQGSHGGSSTGNQGSQGSQGASAPTLETMITDPEITDVVNVLSTSQLQNVYENLHLSPIDVEKVEDGTNFRSPDLKAKAVLRYWRQINGNAATKQVILKALEDCRLIEALDKINAKWIT